MRCYIDLTTVYIIKIVVLSLITRQLNLEIRISFDIISFFNKCFFFVFHVFPLVFNRAVFITNSIDSIAQLYLYVEYGDL